MPDRHTAWGASGWGFNAREPWAPPRFTAEPAAEERGSAGRASLVVLAVLSVLLAGTAYSYGVLHLF
ncbi:hypothetical protein LWC35_01905 [Pseudonocardia kujensis]|uniref:hypothetical protein n=1 Tax=Pseudonocardia kujensis TaxID=1128675 RepID=UPI001E3012E7|nr:hypothetical protein [Pseudonocardia kujensis]MCE0761674.1 hypothetical protein [Pseudonocardia kujensis]